MHEDLKTILNGIARLFCCGLELIIVILKQYLGGDVVELQNRFGHVFMNQDLLQQALSHRSCGPMNNERLEFIGDALLNCETALWLFEQFPRMTEGNMSRIRAALVRQDSLAQIAKRIDVATYLRVEHSDSRTQTGPSMLADAVEALIGAAYIDQGFNATRKVIRHHLQALLVSGAINLDKDPKTALQEHLQGNGIALPKYAILRESKDSVEQRIEVTCTIQKLGITTSGVGASRKMAEGKAAAEALQKCRIR